MLTPSDVPNVNGVDCGALLLNFVDDDVDEFVSTATGAVSNTDGDDAC